MQPALLRTYEREHPNNSVQPLRLDSRQVKFATFDLGPDTLKALQAGDMQFAIDQQQYLQGYLPVLFLMLYKEYMLMPGGGQVILSGPNFVTKETAGTVLSLSQQGIR